MRDEIMTNALSIETILSEFDENTKAWLLTDTTVFPYKYLFVPSEDGRAFYRFFLRREDAEDVLTEILDVNENLENKRILPTEVNLLHTASLILMMPNSLFSIHSPNEVYNYVQERN